MSHDADLTHRFYPNSLQLFRTFKTVYEVTRQKWAFLYNCVCFCPLKPKREVTAPLAHCLKRLSVQKCGCLTVFRDLLHSQS